MSKISLLPPALPLTGQETVPLVQNGETVQAAIGDHIENLALPFVDRAENASTTALAASNFIDGGLAAGEAATNMGDFFTVEEPAGIISYRVREAGGSREISTGFRPETLALPTAAAGIGTASGANIQDELDDISNDNMLSPVKKGVILLSYQAILDEQGDIDAQAQAFDIVAYLNSYNDAIATLTAYLGTLTLPTPWSDTSGGTIIDGNEFRSKFRDVYSARQALLNRMISIANHIDPNNLIRRSIELDDILYQGLALRDSTGSGSNIWDRIRVRFDSSGDGFGHAIFNNNETLIPVIPGQRIFCAGKFLIENGFTGSLQLLIHYYDYAGNYIAASIPISFTGPNNIWTDIKGIDIVPAGAAYIRGSFWRAGYTGGAGRGFAALPYLSKTTPLNEISVTGSINSNNLLLQGDGVGCYIRPTNTVSGADLFLGARNQNIFRVSTLRLAPTTDNVTSIGSASERISTYYGGSSAINTSDEREKTWRGPLTDAEYQAGLLILREFGFFQWTTSIADKGAANARYHFGVRAQKIWHIFADAGLIDPIGGDGIPTGSCPYAFLCFDAWPDKFKDVYEKQEFDITQAQEMMIPTGEFDAGGHPILAPETMDVTVQETRYAATGEQLFISPAGNRYGIRPDMLNNFLIAVQNRRLDELEAAISII